MNHFSETSRPPRRPPDVANLVEGVIRGDRTALARAITLAESDAPQHARAARELLHALLPRSGKAVRVGITGIPGAGKSTFIDAFGCLLCQHGHKVAVLAVDPSSTISHGSILGDKTRMEALAREPAAFIRPSPARGTAGGVAQRTREAMLLCEAAGFDIVLIETVGVGQNEVAVRSIVDFFALLTITGGGDELQSAKRGIMELVDAILVTKADGDNAQPAATLCSQLETALAHLRGPLDGWRPRVSTCSALTGTGLPETWRLIEEFYRVMRSSGALQSRRQRQLLAGMDAQFEAALLARFLADPAVVQERARLQHEVRAGCLAPLVAAEQLARFCGLLPQAGLAGPDKRTAMVGGAWRRP